jgi:hypothetical protein
MIGITSGHVGGGMGEDGVAAFWGFEAFSKKRGGKGGVGRACASPRRLGKWMGRWTALKAISGWARHLLKGSGILMISILRRLISIGLGV